MLINRSAHRARVLVSLSASLAIATGVDASTSLNEIVVTATRMEVPLMVITDPKAPRQPLPAHDGADYLKTIPGFSVIRKGGTDGDPVFRGMAASRVNILLDGEQVLGGCGMRMDPPTAYVFPEAYDRIVVVKGPQTVLHGPGNSAASVSFERDIKRFEQPDYALQASALSASAGRDDLVGDLRVGNEFGYGQVTGTRADSDDYEDGAGNRVHSAYRRWSASGALGWTPDDDTLVEVTGIRSDGEAAYADRAMDGVSFDRDNLGLRLEHSDEEGLVRGFKAQLYYNYVDHVMDNYSLRTYAPTPMMPGKSVSNPDRRTTGGKATVDLAWGRSTTATAGVDLQENQHSLRSTMNEDVMPYQSMTRVDDAWFRSIGLFSEVNHAVTPSERIIFGLRADAWEARDERETLQVGMANLPNPTANENRDKLLPGGFARYEHDLGQQPATLFIGLGHVQRFPDYWELVSAGKESVDNLSAFNTAPEKTTQLDTGLVYTGRRLSASVSTFYSDIDDYILIETGYMKGMRSTTVTRNIDAYTWGGEADAVYTLAPDWRLTGTLAYTRGENRTDDQDLAQMPPLELRTGLDYTGTRWSAGALWRVVAAQNRYTLKQGNIVGQDLGPTDGFGLLSLNAGWRPTEAVLVSAGIDNLFDKTYAEHLSRGGAAVAGYEQTTRVNEPGRTLWLKIGGSFN